MRRLLAALVGVLALGFAVAVPAFDPSLPTLTVVGRDTVVYGLAAVATLVGVAELVRAARRRPNDGLPSPGTRSSRGHETVAESIDRTLERSAVLETASTDRRRSYHQYRARRRVREIVIAVLADRRGLTREEAADRTRDGSWTDDPRAAAYLAGHVEPPLRIRLRDWAHGDWTSRSLEATIAELERLAAGGPNSAGSVDGDRSTDSVADDRGNGTARRPDLGPGDGGDVLEREVTR